MGRIGNSITTWEREIKERDFVNGVIAYVVDMQAITIEDLKKHKEPAKIINKIKILKVEKKLLKEWEECYFNIKKIAKKAEIFNIEEFLRRLEKLLILHLISRGFK